MENEILVRCPGNVLEVILELKYLWYKDILFLLIVRHHSHFPPLL